MLGKLLKYFTPSPSQAKSVPKKITTYSHLGEQVPPKGIENFDNVFYRNTPVDDLNILDDLAFKSGEAPDNLSFFTPSKKEYSAFGPVKYSAEINPTNPYLNKYRGKYWHSDEIKNLMDQGYDAIVTNKFEIPDWYGRLDKAHEIIKTHPPLSKHLGIILFNKGKVLLRRGQLKKAREIYEDALELAKMMNDEVMEANVSSSLGIISRTLGNIDLSEQFFHTVLSLFEKNNDAMGKSVVLLHLALNYRLKGNYEQEKKHIELAIRILENLNSRYYLSACYTEIAHHYSNFNELENALYYYQKVLDRQ